MKAARIARKDGGPAEGDKEYESDLKDKPKRYNSSKVEDEAEERKAGGKVAKKVGGTVAKKAGGAIKKNVGGIAGSAPKASAARTPRKSGGSCDSSPFSSARAGTPAKGHSTPGSTD